PGRLTRELPPLTVEPPGAWHVCGIGDPLLRRSSPPRVLPASLQVGDRITLSASDRCSPRFAAASGTQRARSQVISSVGHLLGYPGFSGGGKGSARRVDQSEPLAAPGGSGVGLCLPGRGDGPFCIPHLRGRAGGSGAAPP